MHIFAHKTNKLSKISYNFYTFAINYLISADATKQHECLAYSFSNQQSITEILASYICSQKHADTYNCRGKLRNWQEKKTV